MSESHRRALAATAFAAAADELAAAVDRGASATSDEALDASDAAFDAVYGVRHIRAVRLSRFVRVGDTRYRR